MAADNKAADRLYKLIAGTRSGQDVVELLEILRDQVCDVRYKFQFEVTADGREAAGAVLTTAIDRLRSTRKNDSSGLQDEGIEPES